jgi:hypothetical protein
MLYHQHQTPSKMIDHEKVSLEDGDSFSVNTCFVMHFMLPPRLAMAMKSTTTTTL